MFEVGQADDFESFMEGCWLMQRGEYKVFEIHPTPTRADWNRFDDAADRHNMRFDTESLGNHGTTIGVTRL